ncbi:MAG: hypothetical protein M3O30_17345 [Planctomycetota bacterium]|nr:hypothetical protein [Planctomycetota bacterium]
MASKQLEILVTARDQASGVLKNVGESTQSLGQKLHALNMESRASGEKDIERLLKGGGALGLATFGAEMVKHAADETREALRGVTEGTMTWGDATSKMLEGLPVFGQFYGAAQSLVNVSEDLFAAFARATGSGERFSESLKSYDTQIADSTAEIKINADAVNFLTEARKKLRDVAATPEQKATQKIQDDFTTGVQKAESLREEARYKTGFEQRNLLTIANGVERDATRLHQEQLGQIEAKGRAEVYEGEVRHQIAMANLKSEARERDLRAAGDTVGAEKEAAARQLNQSTTEADLSTFKARLPWNIKRFDNPFQTNQDDKALAREKFNSAVAAADFNAGQERKAAVAQQEADIADLKSQARTKELEAHGRFLDAQLEGIKGNYEKQRAEVDKQFKELLKKDTPQQRAADLGLKEEKLSALDTLQQKEESEAAIAFGRTDQKKDHRADLEISQFLTGVSAKAGQEAQNPYQPVVDATKEQTTFVKTIADLFAQLISGARGKPAIPVT